MRKSVSLSKFKLDFTYGNIVSLLLTSSSILWPLLTTTIWSSLTPPTSFIVSSNVVVTSLTTNVLVACHVRSLGSDNLCFSSYRLCCSSIVVWSSTTIPPWGRECNDVATKFSLLYLFLLLSLIALVSPRVKMQWIIKNQENFV